MTTRDPTPPSDSDSKASPDPADPADSPSPPPTSARASEPRPPRSLRAGRPRVEEAVVVRDRGRNAMVRVRLGRGDTSAEAVRDAVGEEAAVLRCAAEATIDALHKLMGPPARFALVGAKRMLAFDAAVLLACVRTVSGPPRKLIGCVPIREDPVVAVARAVLHATNRIIEAIPNADEEDAVRSGDADEYETEAVDGLEATGFDPDDPALDDGGSDGSAPDEED